MNRKFGAPSGAFLGVNGVQSGFESRTSSLTTPLNPDTCGFLVEAGCDVFSMAQPMSAAVSPVRKHTIRDPLERSIDPPQWCAEVHSKQDPSMSTRIAVRRE